MSNDDKKLPVKVDIDKKSIIIISVLVIVFIFFVIRAFTYIPEPANTNVVRRVGVEDLNSSSEKQEDAAEQKTEEEKEQTKAAEELKDKKTVLKKNNEMEFETIKAPEGAGVEGESDSSSESDTQKNQAAESTPEDNAQKALINAKKYAQDKKYAKALAEYQKVPELVKDRDLIASSYEGIAQLYAINKRYGTALSYATKAYNMSPSSSREILIARIYYKTGDIDKATKRINNVLHRDFADDK